MRGVVMRSAARTAFVVAAIAVALGGCSSDIFDKLGFGGKKGDKVEAAIYPTAFKQEVLRALPDIEQNIDGSKDSVISDPTIINYGETQIYFSCVKFNPHAAGSAYLGERTLIAYFLGGNINQLVNAPPERCAAASYKPFPELDKYCRGATCK